MVLSVLFDKFRISYSSSDSSVTGTAATLSHLTQISAAFRRAELEPLEEAVNLEVAVDLEVASCRWQRRR